MPELLAGVYPAGYAGCFSQALVFEMIGSGICVYLRPSAVEIFVCLIDLVAASPHWFFGDFLWLIGLPA
ncbi:MAG: hypothetical protein LBM04_07730 [Opitutaceae bacterium]|jgi:hypothetical protein|nr:hypothetical protein [Opitutaceae bacterium]